MIISTNILAKYSSKEFNYIVTPAASSVSKELFSAFEKRYRSFCLIGNYGTGKSSFLYALELSLTGRANYFQSDFRVQPTVRKCIGSYTSLIQVLSTLLECGSSLDDIKQKLLINDSLGEPQFIFIDEFGKLVEYSLSNNPKEEIYAFQIISEYINNELDNTVLVTTLHQSFESYTLGYGQVELAEWENRCYACQSFDTLSYCEDDCGEFCSECNYGSWQDEKAMAECQTHSVLLPLKTYTQEEALNG